MMCKIGRKGKKQSQQKRIIPLTESACFDWNQNRVDSRIQRMIFEYSGISLEKLPKKHHTSLHRILATH